MIRNYARELSRLLEQLECSGEVPKLLLHVCCAPCSSAVLEMLSEFFDITLFFYNPNISPREEYEKRVAELEKFLKEFPAKRKINWIEGPYEPELYFDVVRGLEEEPEGGKRCLSCFRLRLSRAAQLAKEIGAEYFTTTLSIGPMKDARALNEIGEEEGARAGVSHLPSNFKKGGGYARSVELSKIYQLYRQNFCGCVYSKRDSEARKKVEK